MGPPSQGALSYCYLPLTFSVNTRYTIGMKTLAKRNLIGLRLDDELLARVHKLSLEWHVPASVAIFRILGEVFGYTPDKFELMKTTIEKMHERSEVLMKHYQAALGMLNKLQILLVDVYGDRKTLCKAYMEILMEGMSDEDKAAIEKINELLQLPLDQVQDELENFVDPRFDARSRSGN